MVEGILLKWKFVIWSADSEEQSDSATYQPTMDLSRFRQLIREAEQDHLALREPPRVKGASKSSNTSNMALSGVYMMR